MSESPPAPAAPLPPPKPGWRTRVRGILLRLGLYPALFLVALTFFQRSMIYYPTRVAAVPAQSAGLPVGQVHDFTMWTSDGVMLHGWHVLAEDRRCQTAADCDSELATAPWVVLFFHGNAGNRGHRVADCKTFAALGADVLIFDYRGYADSSGSPSETGLTADARALWNYATQERHVPPERILLNGESLGGAVATRLAADLSQAGTPPAGLILLGTFSSLVDMAAYHYPWIPARWLLIDRYDSARHIAQVTCPILQFHGTHDDIVPVESGRRLFAASREQSRSGIAKEFLEVPHAGHNDFRESDLREPLGRFFERLAKKNGNRPQTEDTKPRSPAP